MDTLRKTVWFGESRISYGDSMEAYGEWPAPDVIISDGPYGLGKFPGEPVTVDSLAAWYAPHVAEWSKKSKFGTTLWFWNSEIGWAMSHPILDLHGWDYQECCIWDKGVAHVAGNCNSKTIRGIPVVSEVAVRYTKRAMLPTPERKLLSIREWVRAEWLRSGLPMNQANHACGVRNAATRKYLTQCHLWYFPPSEAMIGMSAYCEQHGRPNGGHPYFSLDGVRPLKAKDWDRVRAKWRHRHGLTNVWRSPAVHGSERFKNASGYLHANQKPIELMDLQIGASTDPGDVVWEPFGGLSSGSVSAMRSNRKFCVSENNPDYFDASVERLSLEWRQQRLIYDQSKTA